MEDAENSMHSQEQGTSTLVIQGVGEVRQE